MMSRASCMCSFVALLALGDSSASAVACNAPSATYPTLGAAARDAACTLVQLAAGGFAENVDVARDVAIQGAGSAATTVQGHLFVSGAGNDVTLSGLLLDGTAAGVAGCWSEILMASGGATIVSGADLRVLNTAAGGGLGCRLFADGFESGGTLAWSMRVP
jgi:hypothetical protein